MSAIRDRYQHWTERARNVIECTDCTPEAHINAIRYLAMEAYDDGMRDGMRQQREGRYA